MFQITIPAHDTPTPNTEMRRQLEELNHTGSLMRYGSYAVGGPPLAMDRVCSSELKAIMQLSSHFSKHRLRKHQHLLDHMARRCREEEVAALSASITKKVSLGNFDEKTSPHFNNQPPNFYQFPSYDPHIADSHTGLGGFPKHRTAINIHHKKRGDKSFIDHVSSNADGTMHISIAQIPDICSDVITSPATLPKPSLERSTSFFPARPVKRNQGKSILLWESLPCLQSLADASHMTTTTPVSDTRRSLRREKTMLPIIKHQPLAYPERSTTFFKSHHHSKAIAPTSNGQ